MRGIKSISENDVIYHRPLSEIKDFTFDKDKKRRRKPKNRAPITGGDGTRRSTLSIRVCLKEFCIEFIKNCYNPLMRAVKVGGGSRIFSWVAHQIPSRDDGSICKVKNY